MLDAVYEEKFLWFSYRLRPARCQRDALVAVTVAIGQRKVGWLLASANKAVVP